MPNLFERAAGSLGRALQGAAGVTIRYSRGAESVSLTAIKGKSSFQRADSQGFMLTTQSEDFIVTASELVLSGVAVEPRDGDEIRETVGSETWVYEMLPGEAEMPWRYSDQFRQQIRIHTKRIRVE